MRTLLTRTVMLALAAAFLAACTSSSLTPDQRDRLAEEYIDGPLSD